MILRCVRILGVALISVALLTACGSSTGVTASCKGVPTGRYLEVLFVQHENGQVNAIFLVVVCPADHQIRIFDKHGQSYDDMNDFRAHNHLLTERDKIEIPRRIPSRLKNVGYVTVSGHTTDPLPIVRSAAISIGAAGAGAAFFWWLFRRQDKPELGDD